MSVISSIGIKDSSARVTFPAFITNTLIILTILVVIPVISNAEGFKFQIRNATKTSISVFYRINEKSGNFKLKALLKLQAGEEKTKDVSVSKGDTISFYGQNSDDETSVIIKRDFATLKKNKNRPVYIPIIIPEKENSNFESLEDLSTRLEHNKVLNFLLKLDSTSMSSMSMLENNFQNVYPLGTFIFVDTKTSQLLIPPLEPSFWNYSENYLTIQDSLYTLVSNEHRGMANVQVAYFVAKMFDSLRVSNTAELEFKAKLSLIRWKPSANANIYQIFNDKSVEDFMQNCYALINNPDIDFQRYRLYFLTNYERIDDLEIYGKKFYNFANEGDLGLSSNPGFQLFSTSLGVMYTRNRVMSNYFSVQNAVLRTRAYDFTALLFNNFKATAKNKIIANTYTSQKQVETEIMGEYKQLVAYNPDPVKFNLVALTKDDNEATSLTPIITTVANLSPYAAMPADTSRQTTAAANNYKAETYNNKVKLFNSHLKEINSLIGQLNQIDNDLNRLSQSHTDKTYTTTANAAGMLNEIEVNSKIVRKN